MSLSFILLSLPVVLGQATKMQVIPSTAPADNQFNNTQPHLVTMPPLEESAPDDSMYGVRDIDLPFGRLYHGNMKYFATGQLNKPGAWTDDWNPGVNDYANQSACGIPDAAYMNTKVAIHPYFLKYAPLDRYCMQDVCISFWKEDGSQDMMAKVTDICSTDPNDPTHCETPADIKLDRIKVSIMEGQIGQPVEKFPDFAPEKSEFPEKTWWFFMKCWGDGTAQPAYTGGGTDNWFTQPYYPNNLKWAQDAAAKQWELNQKSYPSKGWPTYPQGEYNTNRNDETSPPINDWVKGEEPDWEPVAGGKGWGKPSGGGSPGVGAGASNSSSAQVEKASISAAQPTTMSTAVAPASISSASATPTAKGEVEDDECEAEL